VIRFPKTPRLQSILIDEAVLKSWRKLGVVISEKLDGANAGISFEDGNLQMQNRGRTLVGAPEDRQFELFLAMGWDRMENLYEALGNRYVVFGEWLYCKHHVFYDKLPGYFIEYDLYDKGRDLFVTTDARAALIGGLFPSAPILHRGIFGKTSNFAQHIGVSRVGSEVMEGVYIKVEDHERVVGRLKVVRPEFSKIRDDDDDWLNRPIVPNLLAPPLV
jgi:hypothetical protein